MKRQSDDYQVIWDSFISNGHQKYLGMIYFGYYDLLYNLGLKYTRDVQTIEDAIQNLFGYFLQMGVKLHPVKNLRGYIIQSFHYQLLKDIKRRNRICKTGNLRVEKDDFQDPEVNEVFEQQWSSRLKLKLEHCMLNLTPKQKEILYLRFQCELSYSEIAIILDIAVDSCYKMVYRSLKELRQDIEKLEGLGHRLIMFFMRKI